MFLFAIICYLLGNFPLSFIFVAEMQDRVRFCSRADRTLHGDSGRAAVHAELCPRQPLLRVGGVQQQARRRQAPQEPDQQNQSQEYPQNSMGVSRGLIHHSAANLEKVPIISHTFYFSLLHIVTFLTFKSRAVKMCEARCTTKQRWHLMYL